MSKSPQQTCKNGRRSWWMEMCSQKEDMLSDTCRHVQYFLHEDNTKVLMVQVSVDSILHWGDLSDVPQRCDKPSFGFWMFIKCPMSANEQWNKPTWDLLEQSSLRSAWRPHRSHSHAYHSPELFDGSTALWIVITGQNWQAHETPQSYSQCQALHFMP